MADISRDKINEVVSRVMDEVANEVKALDGGIPGHRFAFPTRQPRQGERQCGVDNQLQHIERKRREPTRRSGVDNQLQHVERGGGERLDRGAVMAADADD